MSGLPAVGCACLWRFNTDVDLLFLTAAGMRGGGGRRQEIEVRGRKVQGEKFQCTFKIRRV